MTGRDARLMVSTDVRRVFYIPPGGQYTEDSPYNGLLMLIQGEPLPPNLQGADCRSQIELGQAFVKVAGRGRVCALHINVVDVHAAMLMLKKTMTASSWDNGLGIQEGRAANYTH